jgi:hypothetical protein
MTAGWARTAGVRRRRCWVSSPPGGSRSRRGRPAGRFACWRASGSPAATSAIAGGHSERGSLVSRRAGRATAQQLVFVSIAVQILAEDAFVAGSIRLRPSGVLRQGLRKIAAKQSSGRRAPGGDCHVAALLAMTDATHLVTSSKADTYDLRSVAPEICGAGKSSVTGPGLARLLAGPVVTVEDQATLTSFQKPKRPPTACIFGCGAS